MKQYDKRMLLLVIFAALLLSAKSIWMDPVKLHEKNERLYSQYAELAAPFNDGEVLPPTGLYTYRTVDVERRSDEGETIIVQVDPTTNQLTEVTLQGEYQAKVRAYILYVLPVKNITVEGGLADNGNTSQD